MVFSHIAHVYIYIYKRCGFVREFRLASVEDPADGRLHLATGSCHYMNVFDGPWKHSVEDKADTCWKRLTCSKTIRI